MRPAHSYRGSGGPVSLLDEEFRPELAKIVGPLRIGLVACQELEDRPPVGFGDRKDLRDRAAVSNHGEGFAPVLYIVQHAREFPGCFRGSEILHGAIRLSDTPGPRWSASVLAPGDSEWRGSVSRSLAHDDDRVHPERPAGLVGDPGGRNPPGRAARTARADLHEGRV